MIPNSTEEGAMLRSRERVDPRSKMCGNCIHYEWGTSLSDVSTIDRHCGFCTKEKRPDLAMIASTSNGLHAFINAESCKSFQFV